jgi:hypothetical protein
LADAQDTLLPEMDGVVVSAAGALAVAGRAAAGVTAAPAGMTPPTAIAIAANPMKAIVRT